jgi:membrane-associated protein
MSYRRFLMFNVFGGIGWVFSMTFLGYYLGKVLGAKDIEKVVYLIIVVSVLPPAIAAIRARLKSRNGGSAEGEDVTPEPTAQATPSDQAP